MKFKTILYSIFFTVLVGLAYYFTTKPEPGDKIDTFNQVDVYCNASMNHVEGRHVKKGYNLGLKWQCVEFVKRYYYQHYNHKMPNTYGHAKDFFDNRLKDGALNTDRGLHQYKNPSKTKPKVGDLLVFDAHQFNKYGHVAIISKVSDNKIEVIQQNKIPTRQTYNLTVNQGKFKIENERLLGWLRL